jgi:cyclopropane fatty-acyl-phospholipid synthase-like methyltransferase
MAIFGMSVVENLTLQRDLLILQERLKIFEGNFIDSKKEAELEIREAKLKAQKITNDADLYAKNTVLKKERIEKELKEFIQAEKELIKKYENVG